MGAPNFNLSSREGMGEATWCRLYLGWENSVGVKARGLRKISEGQST